MKTKYLITSICVAGSLVLSTVQAADLRGKLTGMPGARVIVTCGDKMRGESILTRTGNFSVTRLPANKSCNFIVTTSNAASTIIRFSTKHSVTTYNGKLKKSGKRIVVTRKTNKR